MQQSNGKLTQTAWADHLRGCAAVANDIAKILDIRDDAARQAMFATIAINATTHHVFLDPIPEASKTPVTETAAVSNATEKGRSSQERDDAAAEKADAQIGDVPKTTTPEMDEGARRSSFLAGVESARSLLNKMGHQPEITPAGLNAYIKKQFQASQKTELGQLDNDELERLTMLLSSKLDVLREKKAKEKPKSDNLEDWP